MNKYELLQKFFPKISGFREVQEPTIDALISGENVLCLMPTGGGKSLIYQIAGLALEKSTLVISPLVALMAQQCSKLLEKGISAINFSGMDYRKQFRTITNMMHRPMPQFILLRRKGSPMMVTSSMS